MLLGWFSLSAQNVAQQQAATDPLRCPVSCDADNALLLAGGIRGSTVPGAALAAEDQGAGTETETHRLTLEFSLTDKHQTRNMTFGYRLGKMLSVCLKPGSNK